MGYRGDGGPSFTAPGISAVAMWRIRVEQRQGECVHHGGKRHIGIAPVPILRAKVSCRRRRGLALF
jgi:hypothetical protein